MNDVFRLQSVNGPRATLVACVPKEDMASDLSYEQINVPMKGEATQRSTYWLRDGKFLTALDVQENGILKPTDYVIPIG